MVSFLVARRYPLPTLLAGKKKEDAGEKRARGGGLVDDDEDVPVVD